ncbi:MAG: hypothetical protein WC575_03450 [Patescibacteria group bacterium]
MTPRENYDNDNNGRSPYRRIIISFFIATIAVVLLILYYTLARAFITLEISPETEILETDIVVTSETDQGELQGNILSIEQTKETTFKAKGTGVKEEKASGQVTIINDNNQAQSLITATRLLSPDKILFRITKAVSIPAGGRTTVEAISSEPGAASEIGPTKFTIPGLNATLQQKIYAESKEPMIRREKPGAKILATDLEDARNNLKEKITQESLPALREKLPEDKRDSSVVYKVDILDSKSSKPADSEATEFTYSVTAKVTAIFYNPENLRVAVISRLNQAQNSGKEILSLEDQSAAVSVLNILTDNSEATLQVKYLGQVSWKDVNKIITKDDLLGRTPEEVQKYFAAFPGIKNVEVKLSPFWVTAVPTIADHIELIIK